MLATLQTLAALRQQLLCGIVKVFERVLQLQLRCGHEILGHFLHDGVGGRACVACVASLVCRVWALSGWCHTKCAGDGRNRRVNSKRALSRFYLLAC